MYIFSIQKCNVCISLLKSNLFLGSLDLGLSLAVSGDTPASLLVHFGLFSGPRTLSRADLEQLASCLKAFRSAAAFSSDTSRILHFWQM